MFRGHGLLREITLLPLEALVGYGWFLTFIYSD